MYISIANERRTPPKAVWFNWCWKAAFIFSSDHIFYFDSLNCLSPGLDLLRLFRHLLQCVFQSCFKPNVFNVSYVFIPCINNYLGQLGQLFSHSRIITCEIVSTSPVSRYLVKLSLVWAPANQLLASPRLRHLCLVCGVGRLFPSCQCGCLV